MMVRAAWLLSAVVGLANGLGSTDTITWGGDNSRTGYQTTHNMDPAIVGSSQFDQLFRTELPGNYKGFKEAIFSQPLVYTPEGSDKQFVYYATTQNNVYKLDAKTGEIVASRSLHIPFLTDDLDGCVDINPTVGITGTGVIDPETETLYLVAKTYEDQDAGTEPQGRPAGRNYIHAIDVNDLSERPNYPINLEGVTARNNPSRMFNGGIHLQRPGLLLQSRYVYAGFGSHCVKFNFTGWVIGWDKQTGELVEHFATQGEGVTNDVEGAGLWMSGGGITADDAGSMFFSTGNGFASQLATIPVNGFNPPTALEQAAVHMNINEDGSLDIVDFFMPHEKQQLDGDDKDLGTSPVQILPNEFSCGGISRIGVITGKNKKTYFLNLDDLGGYRNGADGLDDVIQVYENENSVYAGAGVYPLEGGYVYINVVQFPTAVFKFSCSGGVPSFAKVASSPTNNGYILGVSHGTVTTLDGQPGTGLLWNTDRESPHVRIYDAVPVDGELNMIKSFNVPGITKFSRAVFGDGIMYVGTERGLVYGFGAPTTAPLNCTENVAFGNVDISDVGEDKDVTCVALIDVTVDGIALDNEIHYSLSGVPNTPLELAAGEEFTVKASFSPTRVGLLSDNILVNTTNGEEGYSLRTSVRLSGTGESVDALLSVSPNRISFTNVVVSDEPSGITQNVFLANDGQAALEVNQVLFSVEGADGPFQEWAGEGALTVGKFTVRNIPATIEADSSSTVGVQFDSTESGTFSGFVKIVTTGGNGTFSINASAGPSPIALVEFQTIDGEDWVEYSPDRPFSFGNVTQNNALSLRMRVSNTAAEGAVRLSLTVSKPPFGVASIVRAANQIDLAEGTTLGSGESRTAVLTCSVPKRSWNMDPYEGKAKWTMNTNAHNLDKLDIDFFCRAVSEQAAPLVRPGEGLYRYIGCFKENNPGRQLQSQLFGSDENESAMCIERCASGEWIFCGTQYHRECWGGNTIPRLQVSDMNCNYDCSGDIQQFCGGNGEGEGSGGSYISVFADSQQWDGNYTTPVPPTDPEDPDDPDEPIPPPGGPVTNPGVAGYNSIGCYTEATTGRALPNGKSMTSPSVANCVAACAADDYTHAGLQYSQECWCGNQLGTGSVPAPASDCQLACKGNGTETCGGNSRLNVYKLGDTVPVPSDGTTTISTQSATQSSTQTPDETTTTATESSTQTPDETTTAISTESATESSTEIPDETTASTTSTSTTSTTRPAPTPTKPVVKETVGNWASQGCYLETENGRALTGKTFADDDMTLEDCGDFCDGFAYFGVQYGRECYCGNTLKTGSVPAEKQSDCSFPCPGDRASLCGAGMRLQLYKYGAGSESSTSVETSTTVVSTTSVSSSTPVIEEEETTSVSSSSSSVSSTASSTEEEVSTTSVASTTAQTTTEEETTSIATTTAQTSSEEEVTTISTTSTSTSTSTTSTSAKPTPTGPIVDPGNKNFTYYSCVSEPSKGRLLKDQIFNNGTHMTIDKCLERCHDFNYAGVEYGRECWCADKLNLVGNTGATPAKNVTDDKCSFLCPGDKNKYCGAGGHMSLYVLKELVGMEEDEE